MANRSCMRIAVQAADLDHRRIDGTRVYIKELLARFGALAPEDTFDLYHRTAWHPALAPPRRANYREHRLRAPFAWTQTAFAAALLAARPDVLWMPMQALPFVTPRGTRTVVTMHDLAFKRFPAMFPARDRRRLNLFARFALAHADHIIAVSDATKRDILHFYPHVPATRISVVHHGWDTRLRDAPASAAARRAVRTRYGITDAPYILYVGALQPRKNLVRLVRAFDALARERSDVRLVLAGGKGWLWEPIVAAVAASPHRARIIMTGSVPFADVRALYAAAQVFAFPSLYEGFGMPLLEAFAAGVPVVTADNSSLPEVAGGAENAEEAAALLVPAEDEGALADALRRALEDTALRRTLIARGHARLTHFSWDACARTTLQVLRGEGR